jgi:hypothetical protein
MATESFLPALPEGYVFSLAKRQNLLCGFHPGQPMLYLDEERMAWRVLDPRAGEVHPALDPSTC